MKKKFDFSVIALVIIAITVTFINFNLNYWNKPGRVIVWDVVSYYAYLPATFIFNDLTLSFYEQNQDPEVIFWPEKTPEGKKVIKTSMGLAMLYLPFFIAGHIVALLSSYPANGFSTPYKFFLIWSSIFYVIIAFILLRKIFDRFFDHKVIGLTFLVIFFGTNLYHYTAYEAAMPHAYNFFLFSLFFYLTTKWWTSRNFKLSIYIGLVAGLIVLVRPTNILIILILVLYGIKSFKDFANRPSELLRQWKHLVVIGLFAFVVWIPQLIYWKYQTGQFLYFSYTGERFFFLNPQIINGLFSYRKGWLVYTPVMVFALAGFIFVCRKYKNLFLPLITFTLLNIYVIYSWWSWWYGGGFGSRAMIDSYPLLAFPLAAFIEWTFLKKAVFKKLIISVIIVLTLNSIFQTYQYYHGVIHWDSMSKAAFFDSFGRLRQSYYFSDHIEPPDYEKAKKGKQAIALHSKKIIKNSLFCDYETLSADGQFFYSKDKRFLIEKAYLQTSEIARSGSFSVLTSPEHPFASDLQIKARKGEIYRITVWRYPAESEGKIIFSAWSEQDFYFAAEKMKHKDDNGWGMIEAEVEIPFNSYDPFRVYLFNPGEQQIYFDDLSIERIN